MLYGGFYDGGVCVRSLRQEASGNANSGVRGSFLTAALIPCFPLYGINIVKNSSYSAWVYLCAILMLRLADRGAAAVGEQRLSYPVFRNVFDADASY